MTVNYTVKRALAALTFMVWAANCFGQFATSFRLDNDGDKVVEIKAVDVSGGLIVEVTGQNPRQIGARDTRTVIYVVAAGSTKRAIFYARYRDVCLGSEWSDWRVVAVCTLQSITENYYFRLRVGCVGSDTTAARAWYQLTVADGMTPPNPAELDAVRFSYDIVCETPAPQYEQLTPAFPESVGQVTLSYQRVAGEVAVVRGQFGSLTGVLGPGGTLQRTATSITSLFSLSPAERAEAREALEVNWANVFVNSSGTINGEFIRATNLGGQLGTMQASSFDPSLLKSIKEGKEGYNIWKLWQLLMKLTIVVLAGWAVVHHANVAFHQIFATTQTFGPKVNVSFLGFGGSDGGVIAALIYITIMATLFAVEIGALYTVLDTLNANALVQEVRTIRDGADETGRAVRGGIYWAGELFPINFALVVFTTVFFFILNNYIATYFVKTVKASLPA